MVPGPRFRKCLLPPIETAAPEQDSPKLGVVLRSVGDCCLLEMTLGTVLLQLVV